MLKSARALLLTPVCPRYLASYEEIRKTTSFLDSKSHGGSESALGFVVRAVPWRVELRDDFIKCSKFILGISITMER